MAGALLRMISQGQRLQFCCYCVAPISTVLVCPSSMLLEHLHWFSLFSSHQLLRFHPLNCRFHLLSCNSNVAVSAGVAAGVTGTVACVCCRSFKPALFADNGHGWCRPDKYFRNKCHSSIRCAPWYQHLQHRSWAVVEFLLERLHWFHDRLTPSTVTVPLEFRFTCFGEWHLIFLCRWCMLVLMEHFSTSVHLDTVWAFSLNLAGVPAIQCMIYQFGVKVTDHLLDQ